MSNIPYQIALDYAEKILSPGFYINRERKTIKNVLSDAHTYDSLGSPFYLQWYDFSISMKRNTIELYAVIIQTMYSIEDLEVLADCNKSEYVNTLLNLDTEIAKIIIENPEVIKFHREMGATKEFKHCLLNINKHSENYIREKTRIPQEIPAATLEIENKLIMSMVTKEIPEFIYILGI